jgi:hypothetical protein
MAYKFALVYLVGIQVTSAGLKVMSKQSWYRKIYGDGEFFNGDNQLFALLWPGTVPLFTANLIACVPQYYLEEKYYKKRDP